MSDARSLPCEHAQIITYRLHDGTVAMWGCHDCRLRFSPGRCNCPESGTSGSCPFHDAWTSAPASLREAVCPGCGAPALAAPAPLAALDVERLARALHESAPETHHHRKCIDRHDLRAEAIAAAYTQEQP